LNIGNWIKGTDGYIELSKSIKLGDDTRSAATAGAGTLRWSSGQLQNSNGTSWVNVNVVPPGTTEYSHTGSDQTFSVPSGVSSITVKMWAAAGGGASGEGLTEPGGPGGYAEAVISVTANTTLIVQVGSGGRADTSWGSKTYPNGGRGSIRSGYMAGNGGGRSGLFAGSVSAANALLIAGAGGGGSGNGGGNTGNGCHGGNGGGTNGLRGHSGYISETENGATQTAGGGGHVYGGQLSGADAGDGTPYGSGVNQAGGGGDGWYGGGVVYNKHQGGGGGSAYCGAGTTSCVLIGTSIYPEARRSTTYPPNTGDSDYVSGVGRGNNSSTGGNGLVIISW
jgi:hypothetical protein